uniref:Uncharacterized protein n=1 Tax=Oryza meridionalis TaxID=40149 RepID=A0A0E0DS88_9ORYZ
MPPSSTLGQSSSGRQVKRWRAVSTHGGAWGWEVGGSAGREGRSSELRSHSRGGGKEGWEGVGAVKVVVVRGKFVVEGVRGEGVRLEVELLMATSWNSSPTAAVA